MENRKIILIFYVVCSMLLWFLARSSIQYLYSTFYQLRRMAAVGALREVIPLVIAAAAFLIVVRNHKANSFLEEVVSELKKVTWPSRQDVIRSTTVVLVCIIIASAILATFDVFWGRIIGSLLKV